MDVSAVPDNLVGVGRYCADLISAFDARSEPSLTLFSRRADEERWRKLIGPEKATIEARAPISRPARLVWGELMLGRAVGKSQPNCDVFFGPHYTLPAFLAAPSVVTVHDLTLIEHPEWHERSKVAVFTRAIHRAARHANAIICVSERTKERLLAHVVPCGAVVTIAHGIDHERFRAAEPTIGFDDAVLERLGIKRPYVFQLGTIEPRKNQRTVVEAFSEIARRDDDVRLVFAGGWGWGTDELKSVVENSPYRDRIAILGYVDHDDVPSLLRRANVVVYPSLDEGFGIPALEALACGVALVTTARSAMAEFAGDAALSVEDPLDRFALAEAITASLDPDLTAERRSRGIEIAGGYSWELCAKRHFEVFRSVLEK